MIKLSELIGQQAVSLSSAEKTGKVTGVALSGSRITAVQLTHDVVPASGVRSFEGDVLTYDPTPMDGEVATSDPRGTLVLDAHGDGLGQIADLGINADGSVETIVLADGSTILGSRLRVVGSFAAVLGDDLPPPTGPPIAP